jgi:hypothetical protein
LADGRQGTEGLEHGQGRHDHEPVVHHVPDQLVREWIVGHVRRLVRPRLDDLLEKARLGDVGRDPAAALVGGGHDRRHLLGGEQREVGDPRVAGLQGELDDVHAEVHLFEDPAPGLVRRGDVRAPVAAGHGDHAAHREQPRVAGRGERRAAERHHRLEDARSRRQDLQVPHGGDAGLGPGLQPPGVEGIVDVGVDEAGQEGPSLYVHHPRPGRDGDRGPRPHAGDAVAARDHDRVGHRGGAGSVDEVPLTRASGDAEVGPASTKATPAGRGQHQQAHDPP